MADLATLFIKVDSKGVVTASKDLNKLTEDSKKTEKATDGVTSSFNKLRTIILAVAASYAVLKMAQYIKDATMLAARYETLGVVMRVVGNNAGFSGAQMEKFAQGLEKTGISMISSRQALIRMTQAQLDLTKSSELARIAQDAAVIGNINSSEAFTRLVQGIQTAQVEVLRNIGINVNFQKSYLEVAKATGRASASFSETEKAQIRLNAVMKAGEGIAGSYEASMETAGKQVLSLERHVENLKVMFGEAFTPALAEIISQITDNIKSVNGELSGPGAEAIKDWGNNFRLTILSIEAEIMRLAMFIDQVGGTLTSIGLFLTGPGALLGMIPGLEGLAIPFEKLADLNILLEERHNATGKSLEALAERYIKLKADMSPAGKAAAKLAKDALETARMEAAALAKKLKAEADALAARVKAIADALKKMDDIERAYNEAQIKAQADYTDFWISKAKERSEVQSRALDPTVDPVDPFDAVDALAERAGYYQDLIGFEDTYHELMLEMIEARRVAEIIKTKDVAAADAKAHARQMELLEEKFDQENKHVNSTIANTGKMLDAAMTMYDKACRF